jgi:cation diffusion facilitator CzcD-associated flavoprotein CzcO
VLPEFLSFSEFSFPEPSTTPHQPFPSLSETHAYLRAFAEPYLKAGKIKLNREVIKVRENGQHRGWSVTFRDWNNGGREVEQEWEAVAVAVGWYDHPVWPNTDGIEELKAVGLAKHAKWYRGPAGYEGKVCLRSNHKARLYLMNVR